MTLVEMIFLNKEALTEAGIKSLFISLVLFLRTLEKATFSKVSTPPHLCFHWFLSFLCLFSKESFIPQEKEVGKRKEEGAEERRIIRRREGGRGGKGGKMRKTRKNCTYPLPWSGERAPALEPWPCRSTAASP